MIKVGFKMLTADAMMPVKAHPTDSGFDLHANENVTIGTNSTALIKTGIAIHLPAGYEAQVRPRSGTTIKTDLRVQLGTIDNGYTGSIGIIADNISPHHRLQIEKGDRIAQLVIVELPMIETYEVDELPFTERGVNGFGSSGY